MDKKKKTIGVFIVGSAIIWGAVIIGCSLKLKGTECFTEISLILSAGAGIHLLIIWGPLAAQLKKLNKEE
ncbi:MAG TPA: hypothetical protein ENO22_03010 [candidate division Zixibacteria bacterium]|nr:hypothetical protein [candidate division Zixibacteria bacterium]